MQFSLHFGKCAAILTICAQITTSAQAATIHPIWGQTNASTQTTGNQTRNLLPIQSYYSGQTVPTNTNQTQTTTNSYYSQQLTPLPSSDSPSAILSAAFEGRVCARVLNRFASDSSVLERVNSRLLNRFGFTCSSDGDVIEGNLSSSGNVLIVPGDRNAVLEVELNTLSPVGDEIPKGASNVHALSAIFTASCTAAVNIDTITISDKAAGLSDDISAVWISIDGERIARPRKLSRAKEVTLSIRRTLSIAPCKSETIDVFFSLTENPRTASRHQFSIERAEDIFTNAKVKGEFPVIGPRYEVSAIQTGIISVEYLPTNGDIEIAGTDRQIIGKVRVSIDNKEDQIFQSMYLENGGRSDDGDFVAMYARATQGRARLTEISGHTNDDRITLSFDPPFTLVKGTTIDLDIVADIIDGTGDTIEMSFEEPTDFFSVGSFSGYGDNGQLYGSFVKIIGKPEKVRIR